MTIDTYLYACIDLIQRHEAPQAARKAPGLARGLRVFKIVNILGHVNIPRCRSPLILHYPSWLCARWRRQQRRFEPNYRAGRHRAPPPLGNSPLRQFVLEDQYRVSMMLALSLLRNINYQPTKKCTVKVHHHFQKPSDSA